MEAMPGAPYEGEVGCHWGEPPSQQIGVFNNLEALQAPSSGIVMEVSLCEYD